MELRYLLDTNAIINLFRDERSLKGIKYFFSIITEFELLSYSTLTANEIIHIKQFCDDDGRVDVNVDIKDSTIHLRRKYNIKLPDAIICGTALTYNLTLVTDDKKLLFINEINSITLNNLFEK